MQRKNIKPQIEKLPKLHSDAEAEAFVVDAGMTDYDLSDLQPFRFEFQPKDEQVNMRLPKPLLDTVKASATEAGMPYQRFIRQLLEAAIQQQKH